MKRYRDKRFIFICTLQQLQYTWCAFLFLFSIPAPNFIWFNYIDHEHLDILFSPFLFLLYRAKIKWVEFTHYISYSSDSYFHCLILAAVKFRYTLNVINLLFTDISKIIQAISGNSFSAPFSKYLYKNLEILNIDYMLYILPYIILQYRIVWIKWPPEEIPVFFEMMLIKAIINFDK